VTSKTGRKVKLSVVGKTGIQQTYLINCNERKGLGVCVCVCVCKCERASFSQGDKDPHL
jgi:hypothetical protein